MVQVKICGITRLDDALAACEAGADALGFNFAVEAKARNRYIAPDAARAIVDRLPPYVTTVAVCVNPSPEEIEMYLSFLDVIQFHGEESVAFVSPVARRAIKVFRVGAEFELAAMLAYPTRAYLLDAAVGGSRGGTGQTCDWAAAAEAVALGKPIVLAGGLTPENVAEAINRVRPAAVDTAGGVEKEPGIKDHERIRHFIQNAKQRVPR